MKYVKVADDNNDAYVAVNMANVSYIEVAKASSREIYCKVYFVGQEKPVMFAAPKYNVKTFLDTLTQPAGTQPMAVAPTLQPGQI